MIGKNATSWSWLNSIGIPALLVIAEATWVSLLIDATVDTTNGPHPDVPFLAIAVSAVAAVAVAGGLGRVPWNWWRRVLVLIPIVVVGVSVSAATLGVLTSGSGSWWSMATKPWSVGGHTAATAVGAAWFVAALAWGRGVWVGAVAPSFRATVWSLGLGAAAFTGIFLGRADRHAVAFNAATGGAGWLLFLWFPLAATVVVLIRERDLEKQALLRARSRPTVQWLTVLTLPMLGVALIALALAVVVGPGAPLVGRAVARVATVVWHSIGSAARWLRSLFPGGHSHPGSSRVPTQPSRSPAHYLPPKAAHVHSSLPVIIFEVLAAVIVVGTILYLARNFRPLRLRWKPPRAAVEDEVRDSVFSWRHLGKQIWEVLVAWGKTLRRRRQRHGSPVLPIEASHEPRSAENVRQAYRRMLRAARASGRGRQANETTQELEGRLTTTLATRPAEALTALTYLYESVRYGEIDPSEVARAHATTDSDRVTAALHLEQG
jgi:hypothetical protein